MSSAPAPRIEPGARLLALVFLLAFGSGAMAQESRQRDEEQADGLDLSLIGGMSYSDNVARLPEDEQDGNIGRAGLLLGYLQKTQRIDADVDVNAMYEKYSDEVFDDDIVGGIDARLTLGILPEKFLWAFQENLGQVTPDPFAAATPDNRENINYFTTGPDVMLRLGGAMSLKLSGRYSDTNYEVSNLDGSQYAGGLTLMRELSNASTFAFVAEANRFEFDDTQANDEYDRYESFLRYELKGRRTQLTVDGGYTSLKMENGEDDGGLLARVAVNREMSSSSTLSVGIGTQFSASGELFRDGQSLSGVNTNPSTTQASSDPFESRFARVGYDFFRNRTGIGASFLYREEIYEVDAALDRTLTTWNLYFSRNLSPVLELRVFADAERQKFDNVNFDSDDLRAGASLNFVLGRHVSLRLQYDRTSRDTSNEVTDFTENQASLFVLWSPLQRR